MSYSSLSMTSVSMPERSAAVTLQSKAIPDILYNNVVSIFVPETKKEMHLLLSLIGFCFVKYKAKPSFLTGSTLPATIPTHFVKHRKLYFFPWWMFSRFHCLKTYIKIMKGLCHNLVKKYPLLLFWIATFASADDTFCNKERTIKTLFWEGKVVDEDDAEVPKPLTCFGFPECCFKACMPCWSMFNLQLQSLSNACVELFFSTHFPNLMSFWSSFSYQVLHHLTIL